MHPLALEGTYRLAAGIVLGAVFGFMIVRSGIAWRKSLLNLITLKDSAFLRTFLFSISIGSLLFYFAHKLGLVNLNYRPVYFWGAVSGGILCGLGIAFCRQVPATAVASFASGRVYSLWVLLGMLLAFLAVKIVSGFLSRTVYTWSHPFVFHNRLDEYFSPETVILWVSAVSFILTLFLQFTLSMNEDGEE